MRHRQLQSYAQSPGERLLAWAYTGPLGHLYSALADISVMWFRHWRARLGTSVRGSRARGSK